MRAIILAAGRGRRMKDKTNDIPKCLLKIKDKTLLSYQLEGFIQNGIHEISIVTGYQSDKISHPYLSKYFHNKDWESTNSCISLMQASDWLYQDDCIISYSDLFYSPLVISKLLTSTADISITYDPNFLNLWKSRFSNPLDDLETFRIDEHSNLIEIGKKPSSLKEIEGQYMGLIKTTPRGWTLMMKRLLSLENQILKKLDMTSLFSFLIQNKQLIYAVSIQDNEWGEVDTNRDLELYNAQ